MDEAHPSLRQPNHINPRPLGTICPPPGELVNPRVQCSPGVIQLECTHQFAMSGGPIVSPRGVGIATETINTRINCRVEVATHQQRDVKINGWIKGFKKLPPFIFTVRRIEAHDLEIQVISGKFRNNKSSLVIPLRAHPRTASCPGN